jgi:hypothetical protein
MAVQCVESLRAGMAPEGSGISSDRAASLPKAMVLVAIRGDA